MSLLALVGLALLVAGLVIFVASNALMQRAGTSNLRELIAFVGLLLGAAGVLSGAAQLILSFFLWYFGV
ncbi:hypothetical protein OSH11_21605 [Kaistia dalseonensis]|uniref:Uncharacterized protein n=1 Tax=Kaistia dalseonensis TaxID=410840 RepID=A0ABU0HDY0_9HYPH|nr:hypothetical protein [Kaistia dalseonensis]MCX5497308.1 hypothetical protein [Kaistia dalseonensis]MDQ0439945.1 hypothetical protein [Kaistia dalseonensis]